MSEILIDVAVIYMLVATGLWIGNITGAAIRAESDSPISNLLRITALSAVWPYTVYKASDIS